MEVRRRGWCACVEEVVARQFYRKGQGRWPSQVVHSPGGEALAHLATTSCARTAASGQGSIVEQGRCMGGGGDLDRGSAHWKWRCVGHWSGVVADRGEWLPAGEPRALLMVGGSLCQLREGWCIARIMERGAEMCGMRCS